VLPPEAWKELQSGEAMGYVVKARDALDNCATRGGEDFSAVMEGPVALQGSVVDNLDGTYCFAFRPTVSGTYTVSTLLRGGTSDINGSPCAVCVQPGPTAGPRTGLFGRGCFTAAAGVTASFTLQAFDDFCNRRGAGGDDFAVALVPGGAVHAHAHARGKLSLHQRPTLSSAAHSSSTTASAAALSTAAAAAVAAGTASVLSCGVRDMTDGSYLVSYTATTAGRL
jgi:hypothetical protein